MPPGKYKFNTGEPVTAQTFADSLMRDLNPKQVSPFVSFVGSSIEGADRLERQGHHPGRPGQRRSADPAPDEAERHDRGRDGHAVHVRDPAQHARSAAKGVTSIAGAGPYYIASYKPNQSLVVKKNPNYTGPRPHLIDEIDFGQFAIDQNQGLLETKNGQLDWCPDCVTAAQSLPLSQQYGDGSPAAAAGKQQMFISPDDRGQLLRHEHGEPDVRRTLWFARRSTTRSTARA